MLATLGDLVDDIVVHFGGPINVATDTPAIVSRRRGGSAASGAGPPENASYEELLAWEEARGAAGPPKGLSRGMIEGLPQRIFLGAEDALKGDEALCAVCQMEYEPGELLSLLPCTHAFHGSCVGRWLVQKPSCPVCMRDVKADMR